jgi:hypothetical protein
MDARSGNTFRYNVIRDNLGAGVRFGGDTPADGANNDAYDNVIVKNAAGAIKFQATPQGMVCGNATARQQRRQRGATLSFPLRIDEPGIEQLRMGHDLLGMREHRLQPDRAVRFPVVGRVRENSICQFRCWCRILCPGQGGDT